MKHLDTLYVVTGVSRLTGERETCSIPVRRQLAELLLNGLKSKPARKRDYLRPKVEPFTPCL